MLQRINALLNFYKKGKTIYDIHSPFLYEFVQCALDTKKSYYRFLEIEAIRNELKSSNQQFEVQDYGAGSRKKNSKIRRVSEIARHALSTPEKCRILFNIAHHFKCRNIIELGTSLGISSAYLAAANTKASLYTLEGDPGIAKIAANTHEKLGLSHIHVVCGRFEDELKKVVQEMNRPDLIYIDGNHKREATLYNFKTTTQNAHDETIVILDDIHWSMEMEEAWNMISSSDRVTLCVDLYYFGIVFFNPNLQKELFHYIPTSYKPWRIGIF